MELISKMIGKELGDIQSMGKNTALCGDEVLIEADGLSAFGRIQDFDLQIHRGEVGALPACWAQAARKRQSFWPAWPSPNRAHCG